MEKPFTFRVFAEDIPVEALRPLIEGRVPTGWIMRNGNDIALDDFYNQDLTEDDLKQKYPHLT
jgi:hypothetical protein